MDLYQPGRKTAIIRGCFYRMEKRKELFSKIAYSCFYLAVIIEVLIVIVDKSNYTNPFEGRLFQLTFLLFLVKVCLTKYTAREYATIAIFCVLGSISYFVTERNEIIRLVMLIAACKSIDMNRCLKLVFWLTLTGCLAIMTLSITGIYGAVSLTQDFGRGNVETRYTLGMGHPNALQCMIWALTVLGLYLYGKKLKIYHYLLVAMVNVGAFLLSDSKTSLIVAAFTIVMAYLSGENHGILIRKICAWINGLVIWGSIVTSVIMAANAYRVYNYDWYRVDDAVTMLFVRMNDLLNGRIRILTQTDGWEGSIQTWSLFSGPENTYFFDMGWIRLFYWYGIIPACIFIVVLLMMFVHCYRKNQSMEIMLMASFSLYTVIEAHAISEYLARNYLFFLMGAYWYQMLPANNKDKVSTLHES